MARGGRIDLVEPLTTGGDMAAKGKHRSMDEVPANELGRWLSEHYRRCGAVLTGLEQEWLNRNG